MPSGKHQCIVCRRWHGGSCEHCLELRAYDPLRWLHLAARGVRRLVIYIAIAGAVCGLGVLLAAQEAPRPPDFWAYGLRLFGGIFTAVHAVRLGWLVSRIRAVRRTVTVAEARIVDRR